LANGGLIANELLQRAEICQRFSASLEPKSSNPAVVADSSNGSRAASPRSLKSGVSAKRIWISRRWQDVSQS
jgi:hypothetical protein